MSSHQPVPPAFNKTNFLHKTPIHIILIIITGVIAYSNTFHVPFYLDDYQYLIDSPFTKSFEYFKEPSKALSLNDSLARYTFKTRTAGFFTFAVNYKLHGFDIAGYHIFNLSIHIINALLVYWLVLLTLQTAFFRTKGHDSLSTVNCQLSTNLIALFSALIFISHPIQTQAVTYISQRFASLATMFYLLSLVLYIKFRLQVASCKLQDTPLYPPLLRGELKGGGNFKLLTCQKTGRQALTPIFWYLGSVVSAVLAMKTKEIAFTLPVIIMLYEFSFFTKTFNLPIDRQASSKLLTLNFKRFLFLTPFLLTLLIIPLSLIGMDKSPDSLIGDITEATRAKTNISRWDYLFTEFRVTVTYLRLLFFPANQNLDHDYPIFNSFLNPNVFLSFLLLLGILGLAVYLFYCSRQHPPLSPLDKGGIKEELPNISESSQAKACVYLQLETCNLKLISFGIFWFFITLSVESSVIPTQDLIFEHRLYLPGIGLIIAFVCFVFYVFSRITLNAEHKIPPHSPLTKGGWGDFYTSCFPSTTCYLLLTTFVVAFSIASFQRNALWQDKTAFWGDVVKKSPNKMRGYNELGLAYMEKGKLPEAVSYFQTALTIDAYSEYSLDIYLNLANAYDELGNTNDAILIYKKIIELNYGFETAHYNLGMLYYRGNMLQEAAEEFKTALSLNPLNYDAKRNLELLESGM